MIVELRLRVPQNASHVAPPGSVNSLGGWTKRASTRQDEAAQKLAVTNHVEWQ